MHRRFPNFDRFQNAIASHWEKLRKREWLDARKIRPKNLVSTALIVAGALLVLYVSSQYGEMYLEQKHLQEAWQQEQARQADASSKPTMMQAHAQQDDGLVRLVIPKIDLTSFVVEGSDHKALLLGPGHLTATAEPGDTGNAVISGHRDTFFRHIHELERGDQLLVERGGKRYVYEVTGKKIVEPTDLSVIQPSSNAQLTLITCYPTYFIGPAPKRLIVFSKLTDTQNMLRASDDQKDEPEPHVQTVGLGAAATASAR